jgi:hypothetical protein
MILISAVFYKNKKILVALIFITTLVFDSDAQEKRNVQFLLSEDFYQWTSKNGDYSLAQTPNIDRLGEKRVLLLYAHCERLFKKMLNA